MALGNQQDTQTGMGTKSLRQQFLPLAYSTKSGMEEIQAQTMAVESKQQVAALMHAIANMSNSSKHSPNVDLPRHPVTLPFWHATQ